MGLNKEKLVEIISSYRPEYGLSEAAVECIANVIEAHYNQEKKKYLTRVKRDKNDKGNTKL